MGQVWDCRKDGNCYDCYEERFGKVEHLTAVRPGAEGGFCVSKVFGA